MTSPASRRGDSGAAVAEIRDRLRRLGLLSDSASPAEATANIFDDAVDEAVRAFQQQRGLTVDGIVGVQTFRHLEEARWELGDRILSYRAGWLISGDDVRSLQQRLASLGFHLDRIDGIFGPQTDRALREFQRSVGVNPDGTCGPETYRALARLARTMSGGAISSTTLRELTVLESLCTGVANKVVVIDPGHGGQDSGLTHGSLSESTVAGDLARRIEGRLAAL
jgi:N-acetylmuramoyl-L-alanine amidase